jgi:hypothetical protein
MYETIVITLKNKLIKKLYIVLYFQSDEIYILIFNKNLIKMLSIIIET